MTGGYPVAPALVPILFNKKNLGFRWHWGPSTELEIWRRTIFGWKWCRSVPGLTWRKWLRMLLKGVYCVDPVK